MRWWIRGIPCGGDSSSGMSLSAGDLRKREGIRPKSLAPGWALDLWSSLPLSFRIAMLPQTQKNKDKVRAMDGITHVCASK